MIRTRGEKNGRFISAIAGLLFIASACAAVSNLWFLRTASETTGTVVANREERVSGRGGERVDNYATIKYFDSRGKGYQFEPVMGKERPIPIGKALPVFYSTRIPRNAYIGGPDFWAIPIGMAALGLFFLMFGVLLLVLSRWFMKLGVPMNT